MRGVMNKTERAYSDRLTLLQRAGEIRGWSYEPRKFTLARRTTYTPDFEVVTNSGKLEYHEVKGFMREDANVKLKVAAAMFPHRFYLVKKVRGGWKVTEVKK